MGCDAIIMSYYISTFLLYVFTDTILIQLPGADPGFQALKKIAPSRGRRENFWGISCEKSRFYAKKSYFYQF